MENLQLGVNVKLRIHTPDGDWSSIIGEVVGVRADYLDPDLKAVKVKGIELWIQLTDAVSCEVLDGAV